jgi:cyclase
MGSRVSAHLGDEHQNEGDFRTAVGPPQLEEVDRGVFAYVQPDGTWWINNTAFVTAPDGVVVVDTCATERRTRAFLETLAGVTPAPIRMLVNTHHHGDHTHGNYLAHPAAIVAHTRCREAMLATGINHYEGVFEPVDWGDLRLAPPILTFDDHVDVWAGDTKIELHYIGTPAHTTNDVVAWLPDRRIMFAGDLVFNGGTPFMLMGSVRGCVEALERIRQFLPDVIVPGHGPVCDTGVLDRLVRYCEFVEELAAEIDDSATSPLDAARATDLGEFAEFSDPERLVGNLHRALLERRGVERGAPMDLAAAIGDMLLYNGGRPLRCAA